MSKDFVQNEDKIGYMMDHAPLSNKAPHVELFDISDDEGSNYVQRNYDDEWVDDE